MIRMTRAGRLLALAVLLCATVVLAACGGESQLDQSIQELDPPVQAVQTLLGLRFDRSSNASAYAEVVATPELAKELAASAEDGTSTVSPIPEWDTPYLAEEATETARVVVVWKDRTEYPGWPVANVFLVQKIDDRWAAVDAVAIEATESIPARPE